jgi:hypothetical protein
MIAYPTKPNQPDLNGRANGLRNQRVMQRREVKV